QGERPRRAGVSSFGISGTNAHVILQQPPTDTPRQPPTTTLGQPSADTLGQPPATALGQPSADTLGQPPATADGPSADQDATTTTAGTTTAGTTTAATPSVTMTTAGPSAEEGVPLLLSGTDAAALRRQAAALAGHLHDHPELRLRDVSTTLLSRARLPYGAAVLGDHQAALRALARGEVHDAVVTGERIGGRTVFVFPGQGSQWPEMARALLDADPVFRAGIDACAEAFAEHTDWSLHDVLRGAQGAPSLDRVDVVQPVLFAVMVSLAAMWRAAGVTPDAVVGHSQGEIAAAYVAGALSLADASRLVTLRSKAIARIAGDGGMVSVALGAAEAAELAARWEGAVEVAVRNGPRSTVVAGDAAALAELLARCEDDGVRARRVPVDYASHTRYVEPLREELLRTFAGLRPRPAEIAFHSAVTGDVLDTTTLDAGYWFRNLRETVRFDAALGGLADSGHRRFVEISPHPVLTVAVEETFAERGITCLAAGTLRRGEGGPGAFRRALAVAHLAGVPVAWPREGTPVDLPTYRFSGERYWLTPSAGPAQASRLCLAAARHPLLGAMVTLADGGAVLTGQIDLAAQGWLADHRVLGTTLLPGTAFAELAAHAGRLTGTPEVRELTVEAPLTLDAGRPAQVQVLVAAPGADGRRGVEVHARAGDDRPWTQHASGTLAEAGDTPALRDPQAAPGDELPAWPPAGTEAVDVSDVYDRLYRLGYDYGPAFQGLTAVWRHGDTVYAELSSPSDADPSGSAQDFPLHPALLDAALHPVVAGLAGLADPGAGAPLLPFAFEGLRLTGRAGRTVRARVEPLGGSRFRYLFADEGGQTIGTIESLAFRPATREDLTGVRPAAEAYGLVWEPVTDLGPAPRRVGVLEGFGATGDLLDLGNLRDLGDPDDVEVVTGADAAALTRAEVVLVPVGGPRTAADPEGFSAGLAGRAHARTAAVLALLQQWAADPALDGIRLTVVADGRDLASAPLRGLVRTAAAEHPGRFALAVVDGPAPVALLASGHGEREVAVRDGVVLAPRLAVRDLPAPVTEPQYEHGHGHGDEDGADPGAELSSDGPGLGTSGTEVATGGAGLTTNRTELTTNGTELTTNGIGLATGGTVLITGGTGTLGALVARRLAAAARPPHLLLVSRSGPDAPGAEALARDLREAGAEVTLVACDVADRDALAEVLAAVPAGRPLRGVVHTAGVLADATLTELDAPALAAVLRPKLDAAWHLHELTAELPLERFVLFSSAVAALGVPGQANYAAANAFLDALAEHRAGLGLPATSVAWGVWEEASAMTGHLDDAGRARLARYGVGTLSTAVALDVLDRVREPYTVVSPLDDAVLREEAAAGRLPALFSSLVVFPSRVRRAAEGAWARRVLSGRPHERLNLVTRLVREQAASVLGHDDPAEVPGDRPLKELGFDSLTSVELRNRLNALTGLTLPATIVFEFPTVAALAGHLLGLITVEERAATAVAVRAADDDPVVIVGMGCRFPGGVASPEDLWQVVASGADVTGDFPDDRGWDLDALYHPDPDHRGTAYTRRGGFLHDAGEFDPAFFGMSPREALATDPQQRLLLQVSWEALERAGIDPLSLRDSDTGVFIGAMYDDYGSRLRVVPEELEGLLLAGNESSVASGRIAYVLGSRGPALTVDTACSSSLVALDLAVRAVRSGECGLALAGGAAVMASPGMFVEF
ncbi:type I polyketide synthase, partial [Microbispora sp. H10885]|uniref:type I polyketide synthase n=1 Tax=Microbispora sp. H10885 TaxID=2729110 RepID=UPI0015FF6674